MKTRLNITIEQNVLEKVKVYAIKKQISVSKLIEDYFESIIKANSKRKPLLDMVDKLDPDPSIVAESYNKESFYENKKSKYGF